MAVRMIEDGSKFLGRSCADCIAYPWKSDGIEGTNKTINKRRTFRSIRALKDAGYEPWPRPLGMLSPCHECPKVDDDAPEKSYYYAKEISEQSWLAIQFHDECEAVGQFPDDPIVRRHAAIIKGIRRSAAQKEGIKNLTYLFSMWGGREKT